MQHKEILVPWPEIEAVAPALGAQSLIYWASREVLEVILDVRDFKGTT